MNFAWSVTRLFSDEKRRTDMGKFQVKPVPKITNKTQFMCQLDVDTQHWVRTLAARNGMTIQGIVQQVFQYARENEAPQTKAKR